MAIVAVKELCKSYTINQPTIKNVSFGMADRAFLTLLGPSGCGKSTILRMIAGLEECNSGDILIDDRRINDLPPAERDIAMVFQSYALYPHMTCYENMAVSLRLRKLPENEIKKRISETAQLLNVAPLLERKPKQLSGGERQRIALGRAIVRQPKVMLLDEPLSNLDAQLRERMRTELKRLFIDMGATIIYVTHDQAEAMSMSDSIVVLRDGELQQQGSPTEIYHNPANLFVAGFLGSPRINIIKGECRDDRFISDSFELHGIKPTLKGPILMGARPEHIEILTSARDGAIAAQIELLEPLGMHTRVITRIKDLQLSLLTNNHQLQSGQSIWLDFNLKQLHFFSTDTEQRKN